MLSVNSNAQQLLDFPDIHVVLKQMRGERMPQGMHMHVLLDAGALGEAIEIIIQ